MNSERYIHPLADVQTAILGANTRVWQYSIVLPGARIGKNCNICSHCFIENDVTIGDNVTIKNGVYIFDGTYIEDGAFIGHHVIFTNDKYPKSKRPLSSYPIITIKRGATVGAGSILLPGITIGEGSIIGAGTLLAKDVPPNTLVKNTRSLISSKYIEN